MTTATSAAGLADTIKEMAIAGEQKARVRLPQLLVLGALAGVYLGFATALTTAVAASIHLPSVQKAVMGVVFPVGLIAIIIGGAELFTGNAMVLPVAAMVGRVRWSDVLYSWAASYVGNLVGSLFVAVMFLSWAGVFTGPGYGTEWTELLQKMVQTKASLSFAEAFWRAVGCVWLVDLAYWLAMRVKEPLAKFFLIWFPTFTFFAIGLEHSVVNMYLFPAAILAGAPITWGQFLLNNLLPVTLGNTVAGAFFVGAAYWFGAGMPMLRRPAAEVAPDHYFAGDARALAKALGGCALATVGFAVLLPGIPAILVRGLLEGSGTPTFPAWGASLLTIGYMSVVTLLIARRGMARSAPASLSAPSPVAPEPG